MEVYYLTIDNYYDAENFSYIKDLVKDNYVLPVNIICQINI